ncbi:MAG: hypothetical protein JXJ04_03650, partial [Spirochaetales bacterium]|nr:hypothetical protein [Spirochaetales bacterium]
FIKTINEKTIKKAHFTQKLKIDDDGNLIYLSSSKGLVKINSNGDNLLTVAKQKLPRQVTQFCEFFPINNSIFIYDDENRIRSISPDGTIEETKKVIQELKEISIQDKYSLSAIYNRNDISIIDKNKDKEIFYNLANDPKNLLIADCFYSSNFNKNKEYFKKIEPVKKKLKDSMSNEVKTNIQLNNNINLDEYSMHFIDYDANHNSYWMGIRDVSKKLKTYSILVFSRYGDLLAVFVYGEHIRENEHSGIKSDHTNYPTSGSDEVAIAPNGDIYFLVGSKENYTLYKVEHSW